MNETELRRIMEARKVLKGDTGMIKAKRKSEWNDDLGDVVWWKFPVEEPSWIGKPTDDDWPGYHTHWTPHPEIPKQHYDKINRIFKL